MSATASNPFDCAPEVTAAYDPTKPPVCRDGRGCSACWAKYNAFQAAQAAAAQSAQPIPATLDETPVDPIAACIAEVSKYGNVEIAVAALTALQNGSAAPLYDTEQALISSYRQGNLRSHGFVMSMLRVGFSYEYAAGQATLLAMTPVSPTPVSLIPMVGP